MHIGILSQWYSPEPGGPSVPAALAKGLALKGHRVSVVTGFPNYPVGHIYEGYRQRLKHFEECSVGSGTVSVQRVPLIPGYGSSTIKRLANYGSFAFSATALGTRTLANVDALWVYNSPVSVGIPMSAVRRRAKPAIVQHVMDLWPESVSASGFVSNDSPIGSRVGRALGTWCQSMYAKSDVVAYIAPSVGELLADRGVSSEKLRYIPLWANEDLYFPLPRSSGAAAREELGVSEQEILIMYAGALGGAQGIHSLIEAFRLVSPEIPIRCVIIGEGTERKRLIDLAVTTNRKVQVLPARPAEQMGTLLAAADIQFVGLADSPLARYTLPSKFQSTLATGKPLLVAGSPEIASLVSESSLGLVTEMSSPRSIAGLLEQAVQLGRAQLATIGTRARLVYENEYAAHIGVDRVEEAMLWAIERMRER